MKQPSITRLNIGKAFDVLSTEDKLYAHHLSCGAWHSTSIILRQVSPESPKIFALIKELYQCCDGNWNFFMEKGDLINSNEVGPKEALQQFLRYAATFLSNMGNYFGEGDEKFVPDVSKSALEKMCSVSEKAANLFRECSAEMFSKSPTHLGFPSSEAQSAYYLGPETVTEQDLDDIDELMRKVGVRPRNTRLAKSRDPEDGKPIFTILIASELINAPVVLGTLENGTKVLSAKGDHAVDLAQIRKSLQNAAKSTRNELQKEFIDYYDRFFYDGDFKLFDNSQRVWMKDTKPNVEAFFGFNYKYRDPVGARAEFQSFVGFSDRTGSRELHELEAHAQDYIKTLPWVVETEDGGKNGPFEMDIFQPPDFNGVHALAYCATNPFLGISMPAFRDNWKDYAWKNIMVRNVNQASKFGDISQGETAFAIHESERRIYLQHVDYSVTFKVTLHELLGHGTGKLLHEDNFDTCNPPRHPLTGEPIKTWYKAGERTSSVFGELDMTLDECRAEAVAAYLSHNEDILTTMGYSDSSPITADELVYNLYLSFGQLGISGLSSYHPIDKKWTSAHDRARFGIMRTLIAANGLMTVTQPDDQSVIVRINRDRIATDAKAAISKLATNLHIIIMTADREGAEQLYETLTAVDDYWLKIRDVVVRKAEEEPPRIYVQANTALNGDGSVRLVEYDATVEGVIRSWMERQIGDNSGLRSASEGK